MQKHLYFQHNNTKVLKLLQIQSNQPSKFEIIPFISSNLPILFAVMLILISGIVGCIILKGVTTANNDSESIINREAKVVSKRQCISKGENASISTHYYVTFEFADGNREEFGLSSQEYELIAEGDKGTLHCQGTLYKDFKRQF